MIAARDYLNLKLWDVRVEAKPVKTVCCLLACVLCVRGTGLFVNAHCARVCVFVRALAHVRIALYCVFVGMPSYHWWGAGCPRMFVCVRAGMP